MEKLFYTLINDELFSLIYCDIYMSVFIIPRSYIHVDNGQVLNIFLRFDNDFKTYLLITNRASYEL